MRVIEILDPSYGRVELEGTTCPVDISLVENVSLGDYVIVHAGCAIEVLDLTEAQIRIDLFAEMARVADADPNPQRGRK